jgi:hypothetical protein
MVRPPFLYGLAHSWSHCAMDSESDVVAHMTGGRVEAVRVMVDGRISA